MNCLDLGLLREQPLRVLVLALLQVTVSGWETVLVVVLFLLKSVKIKALTLLKILSKQTQLIIPGRQVVYL